MWGRVGRALVGPPGALVGSPGPLLPRPLWAGPRALAGRVPVGHPGPLWAKPLWAPWVGQALVKTLGKPPRQSWVTIGANTGILGNKKRKFEQKEREKSMKQQLEVRCFRRLMSSLKQGDVPLGLVDPHLLCQAARLIDWPAGWPAGQPGSRLRYQAGGRPGQPSCEGRAAGPRSGYNQFMTTLL